MKELKKQCDLEINVVASAFSIYPSNNSCWSHVLTIPYGAFSWRSSILGLVGIFCIRAAGLVCHSCFSPPLFQLSRRPRNHSLFDSSMFLEKTICYLPFFFFFFARFCSSLIWRLFLGKFGVNQHLLPAYPAKCHFFSNLPPISYSFSMCVEQEMI